MMSHASLLHGFESHQDAAKAICGLRYDALRDLLYALADQLEKDAKADVGRDRPRLAENLSTASYTALSCAVQIDKAWTICAPHMEG